MGHYPRHRVCGEFISGHGQETLRRLGLLELLLEAGAQTLALAQQTFDRLGMTQTKHRNGVLLFFAPLTQQFAIVGEPQKR